MHPGFTSFITEVNSFFNGIIIGICKYIYIYILYIAIFNIKYVLTVSIKKKILDHSVRLFLSSGKYINVFEAPFYRYKKEKTKTICIFT